MLKGLLLVLVVSVMATETSFITDQLRQKLAQTEYNAQLVDMLELSLQQGSKIDSVIELLEQMINDITGQQNSQSGEHSTRMAQYTSNIDSLENNLESLTQEMQNNNLKLGDSAQQIASLSQSSAALKKQLNLLNAREEEIRNSRRGEGSVKEKRGASNEQVLKALEQILQRLSDAVLNESGAFLEIEEKNSMVRSLKSELGDRHPVALMVEITTQFDEATARNVIDKLEKIMQAIKDSAVLDVENEQKAQANYEAMLSEVDNLRGKLGADRAKTEQLLKTKQTDLNVSKRRAGEIEKDQKNTEKLLQSNRVQRDQYDAGFNTKSQSRQTQLSTLNSALQLLKDNAEKFRK